MTRPDPHQEPPDAPDDREAHGLGRIVQRLRRRGLRPEERLTRVIEEHRLELDEHTRQFEETLADLERREQLLSDSRASVERLLRLGTTDLDERESDIAQLLRDLTEREASLRDQEEELARRRSELGAVELKRLALEQRERSLDAREERIVADEHRLGERGTLPSPGGPVSDRDLATLAFVPGARYRLLEIEPVSSSRGESVEIEGEEYVVARIGPSPLPGDARRCAYLLRGALPRDGSS